MNEILTSPVLLSIIVYKSSQRSKKVRLQHFFTPDKSTVTSLVYKKNCLYVGLVSGSVAVYPRSQGKCFKRRGISWIMASSLLLSWFGFRDCLFVPLKLPEFELV